MKGTTIQLIFGLDQNGCTDPFADNYDPSATIDSSYTNCYDVIAYAIYKDGLMVGSTTSNYHSFTALENGREYSLGVGAICRR